MPGKTFKFGDALKEAPGINRRDLYYWISEGFIKPISIRKRRYADHYGPTPACLTHGEYDNIMDNRLSERHRKRLNIHLNKCTPCQENLEELREIKKELMQHNIQPFDHTIPGFLYRIYDGVIEMGREMIQKTQTIYRRSHHK
jgi:hypothetical protein|tara:strand:+ start:317 stop:745 length:429 start_codon:yes stop_codon:yes gene_type:complete